MPTSHERSLSLPLPVRAEYPVFAIISDTHVGARNSVYPAFIRVIDEMNIDTIIHRGDVINKPGSLHQWKRFFETTGSEKILHVALGNHDIRFKVSREVYGRFFPSPYYSFSKGDTLFVMLNTVLPRQRSRITGRQLKWLRTELARSFRFKFVLLHEPLFPALPLHGLNIFRIQELLRKGQGTSRATGHYGSATTPYRLDPVFQAGRGQEYL